MAKSTFLQLCNTTLNECGISGGDLTTVVGVTGMRKLLVGWVAQADLEVQSLWFDWDFLWKQFSTSTVIGTAAVSAPSDIGVWDADSFWLDYTTATNKPLKALEYKTWRNTLRQGVQTNQKPDFVVIKPDQSLILHSPPDAIYTLTADYWIKPAKMTTDSATSPIPEEYERIIVARAKIFYAEYEAAAEVLQSGQQESQIILDKLEAKYLSIQTTRGMSDAGEIVVRLA